MSGHSFGAVTTEAVSGEALPISGKKFTDPRIKAALVFSPSAPLATTAEGVWRGEDSVAAHDRHEGPCAHRQRGHEIAPGRVSGAPRRAEYEVVLHDAEHSSSPIARYRVTASRATRIIIA